MQALNRPEDLFADTSIQLKPVFLQATLIHFYLSVLDTQVLHISQELGTADFLIHHIHALTIHIPVLVLLKGVLYATSSRLVSDKLELGFRYPCDGPGRGGTCQISPWDHVFLALASFQNSTPRISK